MRLLACKERRSTLGMDIGGRQVAWFEKDSDAVDWLKRLIGQQQSAADKSVTDLWPMYRGAPDRNAWTSACAPTFSRCWRVPLLEGVGKPRATEEGLRVLQQYCGENDVPMLPALHPLAVGDRVLMHQPDALGDRHQYGQTFVGDVTRRPDHRQSAGQSRQNESDDKATLYRLRDGAGGLRKRHFASCGIPPMAR